MVKALVEFKRLFFGWETKRGVYFTELLINCHDVINLVGDELFNFPEYVDRADEVVCKAHKSLDG